MLVADLDRVVFLTPAWCTALLLRYLDRPPEGDGATISVNPTKEYRHAFLLVRPCYFTSSDQGRREMLAHELLHIAISPAADFARDWLQKLAADEKVREFLEEQLRERVEGAVQDLSHSILRHPLLAEDLEPHPSGTELE